MVAGDDIFRLYDSLGVPVDFIEDLATERGLGIDREGFDRAMEQQRERARAASAFELKKTDEFRFRDTAARERVLGIADAFEGYTATTVDGVPVVAVFDAERTHVDALREGQAGFVVLARTPFYVESGGQVSDTGDIVATDGPGSVARVDAMGRLTGAGPRVHHVQVTRGEIREGATVTARVDTERRDGIRRNHTATHLLHAALRTVLGGHVKQAGSLVAPDRLRFDFAHFAPITREELDRIERIVNGQVYRNTGVETTLMKTDEAIAQGAMALFGEKWRSRPSRGGARVQPRVVRRHALPGDGRHRTVRHRVGGGRRGGRSTHRGVHRRRCRRAPAAARRIARLDSRHAEHRARSGGVRDRKAPARGEATSQGEQ